ncbi:MAG: DNA-directed RNA polymerase subunit alpha [Candidatus Bipolaricaulota bacterium]|nr:DNA-directed RNA polymerase subunit alpha [Candidatus Bipolaricaulota bacterium]MCX7844463.1 DNA-directed RNA polymerase subunit alpha [Candidatus Bipolaricaulota bacterium]MDW8152163.1 DNA-directed RNA polymerase subunit alpha [Candidatus Bipolaricaulota bacterium]
MADFLFPETASWVEHTDRYGRLVVAPLERGYATTLGNALRRVLLSSIPGAAVVRIYIPGKYHEYDVIEGVREDILTIILNLKGLAIRAEDAALHRMYLNVAGPKEVVAADIQVPAGLTIVNPDHYIATVEEGARLEIEMEVEVGRGFRPAEENKREDAPLGLIPVDADFSPVEKVNFVVEETRVGGRSGYERLVLEVWTNGALSPREAVREAVSILRRHLALLEGVEAPAAAPAPTPSEYDRPLTELGFEIRACNLLREAGIVTLGDLLARTREEIADIHGLGEKTLAKLEQRLQELGHRLRSEKEG